MFAFTLSCPTEILTMLVCEPISRTYSPARVILYRAMFEASIYAAQGVVIHQEYCRIFYEKIYNSFDQFRD